MGIAERKEREKQQRRESILDAAEHLFFTKGIENTTMDDVAEAAEFSKGTLYLYFKNRDDIAHGIYLRAMEILAGYFTQALETEGNGLCKVRAIGEAYYQFSKDQPNYFREMNKMNPSSIDMNDHECNGFQCHLIAERVKAQVAQAVAIGIEDGSIRPQLDPRLTAFVLWGQASGIINIMLQNGEHMRNHHGLNPDDMIPAMFDMIFHALRNIPGH